MPVMAPAHVRHHVPTLWVGHLCMIAMSHVIHAKIPDKGAGGANYQRSSRGPSLAPIQVQSRTIAPYQIAINGRESSEQ